MQLQTLQKRLVAEISFDDATTEIFVRNEISQGSDASDPATFAYPIEPSEPLEEERPLEDAIPKDFDMSRSNLSVVAMQNPSSEIFSGRANCRKLTQLTN